jgi:hypothetical protein
MALFFLTENVELNRAFIIFSTDVHIRQGVTKRCRLSWLANSALLYEPAQMQGGGVAGSQPMRTAVHRSPNKLWRSNSIFNLLYQVLANE